MKKYSAYLWIFAISSFLIACNKENIAEDPLPDKHGYKLVWEDNFDKTMPDFKIWNIELVRSPANRELQEYKAENITIEKEPVSGKQCLTITAKKETTPNDRFFTSGRLNTMKKVAFRFGRIDASIKLPKTANGLWPAFWMKGNDNDTAGWPSCGEIDILEMGNVEGTKNNTQESLLGHACHWGANAANHKLVGKKTIVPYSLQDDKFHLYTLIWDEEKIAFYVDLDIYPDQEPYFVFNHGANKNNSAQYFNKEFYILLNLAVGGEYTGIVGKENIDQVTALNVENNYEAKMYIDYIRIYQQGKENEKLTVKTRK